MDYSVTGKAPDTAQAVVPHYLDGDGLAVPASLAQAFPTGGAAATVLGTTADPPLADFTKLDGTATIKAIMAGLGVLASSTAPVPVIATPTATGALTPSSIVTAASNNATSLKAAAGQVYAVAGYCVAAYPVYLKFYDKTSAAAPATDVPVFVVAIPVAGSGVHIEWPTGLTFTAGIAFAVVKGIGAADNTNVAAADAVISFEIA